MIDLQKYIENRLKELEKEIDSKLPLNTNREFIVKIPNTKVYFYITFRTDLEKYGFIKRFFLQFFNQTNISVCLMGCFDDHRRFGKIIPPSYINIVAKNLNFLQEKVFEYLEDIQKEQLEIEKLVIQELIQPCEIDGIVINNYTKLIDLIDVDKQLFYSKIPKIGNRK